MKKSEAHRMLERQIGEEIPVGALPYEPREHPMLFADAMVCALLDDRKTQTRRFVKLPKRLAGADLSRAWVDPGLGGGAYLKVPVGETVERVRSPWSVGQRIWVREAFVECCPCLSFCFCGEFREKNHTFAYRADGRPSPSGRWTPSIHMPRRASRITLEITEVRVERLHAITEEDARAEGAPCYVCGRPILQSNESDCACFHGGGARASFESLWCAINGEDSWRANGWCWVVSFKRVSP